MEKKCTKCGEVKPLSEFYRDSHRKDGYTHYCKACKEVFTAKWRNNHPDTVRSTKTLWNKNNPERVRTYESRRKRSLESVARSRKRHSTVYRPMDRLLHPEKYRAREAVKGAVKYRHFPGAKTLKCISCGKQAEEYHHHNGYAKEHWLDVVPVCHKCHMVLEP